MLSFKIFLIFTFIFFIGIHGYYANIHDRILAKRGAMVDQTSPIMDDINTPEKVPEFDAVLATKDLDEIQNKFSPKSDDDTRNQDDLPSTHSTTEQLSNKESVNETSSDEHSKVIEEPIDVEARNKSDSVKRNATSLLDSPFDDKSPLIANLPKQKVDLYLKNELYSPKAKDQSQQSGNDKDKKSFVMDDPFNGRLKFNIEVKVFIVKVPDNDTSTNQDNLTRMQYMESTLKNYNNTK
uniref:Uncharacterized protein n=1 Tax=Rhabditophanes sp. KR3021 TaxID=114890 RepID=A0AC35TK11_9BILA